MFLASNSTMKIEQPPTIEVTPEPQRATTLPGPIDGVYVGLPEALVGFDAVEIRGDDAWWNPHLQQPTLGHVSYPPEGVVRFRWGRGHSVETGYAVANGSLWLFAEEVGPVGMLPSRDRRELVGTWATAVDVGERVEQGAQLSGEHRLRVAADDEILGSPHYLGSSGARPPGPHRVPNSDHYRPNERGIVLSPYGWDCMMNHLDEPGYLLWFPMDDDRIWAHHEFATHGWIGAESYVLYRERRS